MNPAISRKSYLPIAILLCAVLIFSIAFIFLRGPGAEPPMERVVDIFESENSMYFPGKLLSLIGKPSINLELVKWKPASELNLDDLKISDEIWYRMPFPASDIENPTLLLIPRYLLGLEVYWNRQCIFKYGTFTTKPGDTVNFAKVAPRMVPFPVNPKGHGDAPPILYVRKHYSSFPLEVPMGEGYAGSLEDIAALMTKNVMRYRFWERGISTIFLFLSAMAFGIFIFRWRARDYMFLSFGFFLLCAGIHYSEWRMTIIFHLSEVTSYHLYFLSTTLLPVGMLAFTGQLLDARFKRFIKMLWLFHIVFVLFFGVYFMLHDMAADFFTIAYNSLVLIETCSIFFLLFKSSAQRYTKILICAFTILFIVAVVDIVRWTIWLIVYETVPDEHFYGIGVVALIGAFGYIIIDHYKRTREKVRDYALELEVNKRKLLQLKSENLQARFNVLKGQLNPHFLFNTFGTLISLIEKNQADAVHFVEDLSRVYRHLLQAQDRKLVALGSELEFTVAYSYLVKKRFGEKVSIAIAVSDHYLGYSVPPLSLQLLIENAIKHNVISQKSPLNIRIEVNSGDYLIVKNNYKKKPVIERPTKVGLINLKQRYDFFTNRKVEVICDEITFLVKIPLLLASERRAD